MIGFKMVAGDIVFDGQNNIAMVDGDDELLQCINEIFKVNVGEWFLNPLHGFSRLKTLGEKFNQERIVERLYEAILQEDRIERVESLKFDFDRGKRQLSIKFAVIKTDGGLLEGGVVV